MMRCLMLSWKNLNGLKVKEQLRYIRNGLCICMSSRRACQICYKKTAELLVSTVWIIFRIYSPCILHYTTSINKIVLC